MKPYIFAMMFHVWVRNVEMPVWRVSFTMKLLFLQHVCPCGKRKYSMVKNTAKETGNFYISAFIGLYLVWPKCVHLSHRTLFRVETNSSNGWVSGLGPMLLPQLSAGYSESHIVIVMTAKLCASNNNYHTVQACGNANNLAFTNELAVTIRQVRRGGPQPPLFPSPS